jgi:hypothetical protein
MAALMSSARAAILHPEHGWKTTHFWGPVANWGLVGAAVYDANFIGPDRIDLPMTGTMIVYSATFLGFFWRVVPRNPLGLACHVFNIGAQGNQIRRAAEYKIEKGEGAEVKDFATKAAVVSAGLAATIASSGRMIKYLTQPKMPSVLQKIGGSDVGPLTVFFWAPASKWLLSANNLVDLKKDTNKMSFANQFALTITGVIWTRYSFVISPVNYSLAAVNAVLGVSSGYHLSRKIKADYMS